MAPPKIDFEKHKDLLFSLYINNDWMLEEVMQYIKAIYNFEAR